MKNQNKLKKLSPHLLWVLASVLIIWAGFLAYYEYQDFTFYTFKTPHFQASSTVQDLGTVMSGSVGILITLSGILFLAFTLYQTHKELNDTQTILKNQLVESTFFNLLKNHKEIILVTADSSDTFTFKEQIKYLQKHLEDYYVSIKVKSFKGFETTYYSPSVQYINNNTFLSVGKSLSHMIDLIADKLNDDEFYHRTLLYNLSNEERFLLGMVIKNELEPINSKAVNIYSEYYNEICHYNNPSLSGYFPPTSILVSLTTYYTTNQNLEKIKSDLVKYWRMQLKVVSSDLKLLGLSMVLKEEDIKGDYKPKGKPFNYDLRQRNLDKNNNLLEIFLSDLLQNITQRKNLQSTLTFKFSYRDEEYFVSTLLGFYCYKELYSIASGNPIIKNNPSIEIDKDVIFISGSQKQF